MGEEALSAPQMPLKPPLGHRADFRKQEAETFHYTLFHRKFSVVDRGMRNLFKNQIHKLRKDVEDKDNAVVKALTEALNCTLHK